MKKSFFTLILLSFSLISLHAQSEDVAVRKTIEDETRSFHTNSDRNVFLSYWNIIDATTMTYSGVGNVINMTGADMRDAAQKGTIPLADGSTASYENFIVRTSGTVAWASFTQIDTHKDGTKSPKLQEFRMLEKIKGAWKITCSSVHEIK